MEFTYHIDGHSDTPFHDWLRDHYDSWWDKRKQTQKIMASKRRDAVRQRRDQSRVGVAHKLLEKVRDLVSVARLKKSGMDFSSRLAYVVHNGAAWR